MDDDFFINEGVQAGDGVCDGLLDGDTIQVPIASREHLEATIRSMFHGLNAYVAGLRQKGAGDREIKLFLDALFGTMRRRAQESPSISKMLTLAQERWPAKLLRHAPAGSSDAPASAHSIERRGRITLCAIGIIALVALIVWLFGL